MLFKNKKKIILLSSLIIFSNFFLFPGTRNIISRKEKLARNLYCITGDFSCLRSDCFFYIFIVSRWVDSSQSITYFIDFCSLLLPQFFIILLLNLVPISLYRWMWSFISLLFTSFSFSLCEFFSRSRRHKNLW